MTHVCEFPTEVRLREIGTLDVIVDLHDPDNGYDIAGKIRKPAPAAYRQARIKGARAGGSYGVGEWIPDDGTLTIPLLVLGSSWPQCEQRLLDVIDAIVAQRRFYIETVLSGVTTRWLCDAPPEWQEVEHDRANHRQRYDLAFLVQPNPSVTIGA